MAHSPEPWTCCDQHVTECEVTIQDAARYERLNSEKGCQTEWAVENFPRIVACVNACAGWPTKDLVGKSFVPTTGDGKGNQLAGLFPQFNAQQENVRENSHL